MFQLVDLRRGDAGDVRLAGVPDRVVLMIGLGAVEAFQRRQQGDDRAAEHARGFQLRDVGRRDLALRLALEKDRRPVLAATVIALAIELGRIVSDCEQHFQQLVLPLTGDLFLMLRLMICIYIMPIHNRISWVGRFQQHGQQRQDLLPLLI